MVAHAPLDQPTPSRALRRQRLLRRQLADARGGRVLVVAHCLLNENVRYLGGAAHSGVVPEVAQTALHHGLGLVQMPCPEQHAWGGVLKTHLLALYGRGEPWTARRPVRHVAAATLTEYTRLRVIALAKQVARDLCQYREAGMDVVAVVGVGASPSCGVTCTMDIEGALADVAGCPLRDLTRSRMTEIVTTRARPGAGIFTASLRRALQRHGLLVPFVEHDLRAELAGHYDLPLGLQELLGQATTHSRAGPGVGTHIG